MHILIHPLFVLTAVAAVFFSATNFFLALTAAVIWHELSHALVAKTLGAVVSRVTLMPFGGALDLQTKILTLRQKCLIYLAGPLGSLLACLVFGVMIWIFPVIFGFLEYLVVANFLVGVINLLPIYPLDGGKILALYVPVKLIYLWSDVVLVGVLIWAVVTFRWWWIFFAIIVLLQINWEFKQSLYFDKFSCTGQIKTGKFVRCAVVSSMSLLTVYRMIDPKRPTEFVVTDAGNQIFYESDIEKWLIAQPFNTCLHDCVGK